MCAEGSGLPLMVTSKVEVKKKKIKKENLAHAVLEKLNVPGIL